MFILLFFSILLFIAATGFASISRQPPRPLLVTTGGDTNIDARTLRSFSSEVPAENINSDFNHPSAAPNTGAVLRFPFLIDPPVLRCWKKVLRQIKTGKINIKYSICVSQRAAAPFETHEDFPHKYFIIISERV